MGKQKLFSKEQEDFILENYKHMSNKRIAEELGVKREQINSWLTHRGIKRRSEGHECRNVIFSDNDVEFIKNNYAIMTCAEIGNILGFSGRQIQGKVNKLNLNNKKRKNNDRYFKEIDTSLTAYLLGFIYADGWVVCNENNGNYELGIELQSEDKYILEKLNEELGGQNMIYHYNPSSINSNGRCINKNHSDVLRVYSKNIVVDLISHGIVPQKSRQDIYPIVNDNLFFDFLRGYIDGDGCYYIDNNQTYMHITSASIIPLQYIQNKLGEFGIKTQIYTENTNKHRLMCTSFNEMNKLINHLYYQDGLFYLQRKYNKIKHFIGFAA